MSLCSGATVKEIAQELWDPNGPDIPAHRTMLIVASVGVGLTLVSLATFLHHAGTYRVPQEVDVFPSSYSCISPLFNFDSLVFESPHSPAVDAVVQALTYAFLRSHPYIELVGVVYESLALSAFRMLLIYMLAASSTHLSNLSSDSSHDAIQAMHGNAQLKEKQRLPLFCCWRYRPTKAHFVSTLKWAVLQMTIVGPSTFSSSSSVFY